jgi:hypothetical protein
MLSADPTHHRTVSVPGSVRSLIRLVPGPPRSGHFVYGGDQTYEQALWPSARLCWRSNAALDGEAMIQDQHMCCPASMAS